MDDGATRRRELLHSDLTHRILSAFFEVYNTLGYGFLEKVYERALQYELNGRGLVVVPQQRIAVFYKEFELGEYYADLIVNEKVIIEIKALEQLCEAHAHQLLNYLRGSNIEVGLLLNFGKKPEFTRKVMRNSNPRKSI